MVAESARSLRPVNNSSVVQQVAAEIRRSIIDSTLAPGEILSLRPLAEQLGVSFIPVREALQQLESQGLVVTERSRSARVAPLDPDELHSIYRLRLQIEPDLCARAVGLRTSTTRLEQLLTEFGDPGLSLDQRHAVHSDFHLELMSPAASTWDLRVLSMLWDNAQRYIRYAFDRREADPDEPVRRYAAHAVLLDCARAGDPEAMREAMVEHLTNNEAMATAGIRQDTVIVPTDSGP